MKLRETEEWKALFAELQLLQNAYYPHQDILTITGFFTTLEELENHVNRNKTEPLPMKTKQKTKQKNPLAFPNSVEISAQAADLLIGNDEKSWRDYRQTELAEASYYFGNGVNIMSLTNFITGVTQYYLQDINH